MVFVRILGSIFLRVFVFMMRSNIDVFCSGVCVMGVRGIFIVFEVFVMLLYCGY